MAELAIGRRNHLFAGADSGGERDAAIYSLGGTANSTASILRHICATCSHASPNSPRGSSPISSAPQS